MSDKKIIILTWCFDFSWANYGQILQCYALYRLCGEYFNEVEVLKYRPLENNESLEVLQMDDESRNMYEKSRKKTRMILENAKMYSLLDQFIHDNIKRTRQCYTYDEVKKICDDADIIMVGSDQLWNPTLFDDVYCPNFINNNQRLVSYGTGGISKNDSKSEPIIKKISERLELFYAVSVRERISAEILRKYTQKRIDVVLDPTLLISVEEWDKIAAPALIKEKYILCFCYGEFQPQKHIIKELLRRNPDIKKTCVIRVDHFFEDFNLLNDMQIYEGAGIAEILSLIKHAEIVCTDSFHGFVFSVIYRKQFYLLYRAYISKDIASSTRINDVCHYFGIGNRWLRNINDFKNIEEIKYSFKQGKNMIEKSRKYLEKVLLSE